MCSSRHVGCFGLLSAVSIAYFIGLWQGSTFYGKLEFSERLVTADALETVATPKRVIYNGSQADETGSDSKNLEVSKAPDREAADSKENLETSFTAPESKGSSRSSEQNAQKSGGAQASKASGDPSGCSKFEDVSFPLDGWPSSVRAEGGQSLYGTGWAQKMLRDHQFPAEGCQGKSFLEHGMFRAGMGSNMHIGAAFFALALDQGLIYQWPEDDLHNPWTLGEAENSTVMCPSGQEIWNYECYFKPLSSCKPTGEGARFTGLKSERGSLKTPSTNLVPRVFRQLLMCSRYPSNYWAKWWRAQAIAFFMRPKKETLQELDKLRQERLVGRMQPGVLGCYVRHGDKYLEATEYPFGDYLQMISWLLDGKDKAKLLISRCPNSEILLEPFKFQLPKLHQSHKLYLGSDDPGVLAEAKQIFGDLIYVNVSRLSKRMPLMRLTERLGAKQIVMESLLNLQLLMESDAFIGSWSSNWCRLVDEMRMTVAMKANYLSLEVNKHCPRFNWVHGGGKDTPDF